MRAVDLFSGAGGWTTGAMQAGVNVLAAVNHWPVAVETHAANHPATEHHCQDVGLMDPRDLPAFDLLLASPACQGHSRARGTDKPHHDAQRATAWCVVNVAEVTRPRAIAVENVPEFRRWRLYPLWADALRTLGYRLSEQVLDASEFGVPQERRRLFVVGMLDRPALHIRSPRLAPVPARSIIRWDAGEWSQIDRPGRAPATLVRIAAGRREFGSRFVVAYYGNSHGGRSVDRPLGTVTCVDRYAAVDGDRMRMLSVEEYRDAMAFPASYRLCGTHRDRVKLLGNAVCPPVAREVCRQICEVAA
jgi:DNA (cytosine-5)-methyltransferase 1